MIILQIIGFVILYIIIAGIIMVIASITNKLAGRIVVDYTLMLVVPLCLTAIVALIARSPLGWLLAVVGFGLLGLKLPYKRLQKEPEKKEYIQGISLRRGRRK